MIPRGSVYMHKIETHDSYKEADPSQCDGDGRKGGKARAKGMTKEELSASARNAVNAR